MLYLSQEESMSSSSSDSPQPSIFVPSDASLYTAQKELCGIFRGRPKVEDFGLGSVEIYGDLWRYLERPWIWHDERLMPMAISCEGAIYWYVLSKFHGHSMCLHVSCFKSRLWYVYCVSCMSKHVAKHLTTTNIHVRSFTCLVWHHISRYHTKIYNHFLTIIISYPSLFVKISYIIVYPYHTHTCNI